MLVQLDRCRNSIGFRPTELSSPVIFLSSLFTCQQAWHLHIEPNTNQRHLLKRFCSGIFQRRVKVRAWQIDIRFYVRITQATTSTRDRSVRPVRSIHHWKKSPHCSSVAPGFPPRHVSGPLMKHYELFWGNAQLLSISPVNRHILYRWLMLCLCLRAFVYVWRSAEECNPWIDVIKYT